MSVDFEQAKAALMGQCWSVAEAQELKNMVDIGTVHTTDSLADLSKVRDAKKWDSSRDPSVFTPIDALKASIRAIEAEEWNPDCLVVITSACDPNKTGEVESSQVSWKMAGRAEPNYVIGMVTRFTHKMLNSLNGGN